MRWVIVLLCIAALAWLLGADGDRVTPVTPVGDADVPTETPGLLGSSAKDARQAGQSTARRGRKGTPAAQGDADDEPWPALRIDTVDAYTGRSVRATWNLGTGDITGAPFPPGTVITEALKERARKGVRDSLAAWNAAFLPTGVARDGFFRPGEGVILPCTVRPAPGYVLHDVTPRVHADLAVGVRMGVHVCPLWHERVLDVRVLDPEGQPARDVSIFRFAAAGRLRQVAPEVRGPGELRIRGIPHFPGEPVRAVLDWGWSDSEEEEEEILEEEIDEGPALRDAHLVTKIPDDVTRPWRAEVRLKSLRGPRYFGVETDNDLAFEETFGLSDAPPRPQQAPASLRVRVLGHEGKPIVGAELWGGVTDTRGAVVLSDRPPGRRTLRMELPGRLPVTQSVDFVSGATTEVTLREPVGARLEVLVTDGNGRPRPSAHIDVRGRRVFDVGDDGVQRLDPYTDAHGRRTFARVQPGKAMITATWGSRTGARRVTLVDGETKRVVIVAR